MTIWISVLWDIYLCSWQKMAINGHKMANWSVANFGDQCLYVFVRDGKENKQNWSYEYMYIKHLMCGINLQNVQKYCNPTLKSKYHLYNALHCRVIQNTNLWHSTFCKFLNTIVFLSGVITNAGVVCRFQNFVL